ncbi:MAG: hypothetical protein JWR38_1963 [Mucilaginibacter sp.]|nr:hypothetical protein [Mucilaginibacter sp.]
MVGFKHNKRKGLYLVRALEVPQRTRQQQTSKHPYAYRVGA